MNKGVIIALVATVGLIGMAILIAVMSYIGANNYGVEVESKIKAEYTNNQNILAQYGQKLQEAAQVPDMQRDDFSKVAREAIEARYGAEGSKAMFQWIQEQNPQLDSKVYLKLQQIIESGRDEFKNSQTKLIDVKRSYETNLGYFWRGMWLRIAGFPKINLDDYKVVVTDRAAEAFKSGKEEAPIKLR